MLNNVEDIYTATEALVAYHLDKNFLSSSLWSSSSHSLEQKSAEEHSERIVGLAKQTIFDEREFFYQQIMRTLYTDRGWIIVHSLASNECMSLWLAEAIISFVKNRNKQQFSLTQEAPMGFIMLKLVSNFHTSETVLLESLTYPDSLIIQRVTENTNLSYVALKKFLEKEYSIPQNNNLDEDYYSPFLFDSDKIAHINRQRCFSGKYDWQ